MGGLTLVWRMAVVPLATKGAWPWSRPANGFGPLGLTRVPLRRARADLGGRHRERLRYCEAILQVGQGGGAEWSLLGLMVSAGDLPDHGEGALLRSGFRSGGPSSPASLRESWADEFCPLGCGWQPQPTGLHLAGRCVYGT
jgi:hypothetical protein